MSSILNSTTLLSYSPKVILCDTSQGSFGLYLPFPRNGCTISIRKQRSDVYKITVFGIFKHEEDAYLLSDGNVTFRSGERWWEIVK